MKIIDLKTTPISEVVHEAIQALQTGGLIIYPTETVYGVGVDATNPEAVQTLLAYKSRREGKPLSVAVTDQAMAEKYVTLSEQAKKIYQRFLPGPFTVISKVKDGSALAPGVASEFNTLGIRMPDHELLISIVGEFGSPITSTSANASGKKRPYAIQDIFENLSPKQKNLISLVLDAGKLPPNQPSTVIDTTLSTPLTMRAGDMVGKIQQSPDKMFTSNSEEETKHIAGKYMLKYWEHIKKTGIVIGLDGKLGAGKTIFTKGIADFLKIAETITSPTYSYLDEYQFDRHGVKGKLHHLDVWKIDSPEDARFLEIPTLIKPNSVVVIEWWQQVKDSVLAEISNKSSFTAPLKNANNLSTITLLEVVIAGDTHRTISINENHL